MQKNISKEKRTDFSKELAGNIRAVRARADLSQAEVASKLGVSVSIFAKYESGDYIPGADKLLAISQVLGCPPNDLMGWNTDETA
ncbi:helix-turn-helix transcriptional regulator [Collinsella aerofaciens]|uniref:helix-turn-helix domain-containing protein n=1 Tax=Collinsella aerofaciens TaxID=74426 RepID=UPI0030B9D483